MMTTISTKGQVVLPQLARRKLGLEPGTRLRCRVCDGTIVLPPEPRPALGKARIARSKVTGLPVIIPPPGVPVLTVDAVREALADFH